MNRANLKIWLGHPVLCCSTALKLCSFRCIHNIISKVSTLSIRFFQTTSSKFRRLDGKISFEELGRLNFDVMKNLILLLRPVYRHRASAQSAQDSTSSVVSVKQFRKSTISFLQVSEMYFKFQTARPAQHRTRASPRFWCFNLTLQLPDLSTANEVRYAFGTISTTRTHAARTHWFYYHQ